MKKAFTLIELLVVVVVLSILLGIVIRFGNITDDQTRRATTISRMQRLENALSGYYAAFGTYPPVKLQSSRNYFLEVSDHGIQNTDGNENQNLWGWCNSEGKVTNPEAEGRAWNQVKAACEAQPVGCYFPYEDTDAFRAYVASYSEVLKSYAASASEKELSQARKAILEAGFDTGVPLGRFGSYRNLTEWSEVQLFRFGVLSYLLPRYLFMMTGPEELFKYAQWTGNNDMPRDPLRGTPYTGGWNRLRQDASSTSPGDQARVANIPSQAVCARWMPNFEKSLTCAKQMKLFGIDVRAEKGENDISDDDLNPNVPIFCPGGYSQSSHSGQYVLNSVTMEDGWLNEFYYYSPAPYQSYVLWSAGPNGKTFPPWVARETLGPDANRCVGYWISDDIVGLSH